MTKVQNIFKLLCLQEKGEAMFKIYKICQKNKVLKPIFLYDLVAKKNYLHLFVLVESF